MIIVIISNGHPLGHIWSIRRGGAVLNIEGVFWYKLFKIITGHCSGTIDTTDTFDA